MHFSECISDTNYVCTRHRSSVYPVSTWYITRRFAPRAASVVRYARSQREWSGHRGPRFSAQTDDLQMPRATWFKTTIRIPVACTKYTEEKDGEKEQCSTLLRSKLKANPLRITPALCERCIFVGRADFDFFVRFENSACCIHARRHVLALANSVCLLALSHSDRHANVLVRVHCTKKRPTKAKTTGKI